MDLSEEKSKNCPKIKKVTKVWLTFICPNLPSLIFAREGMTPSPSLLSSSSISKQLKTQTGGRNFYPPVYSKSFITICRWTFIDLWEHTYTVIHRTDFSSVYNNNNIHVVFT